VVLGTVSGWLTVALCVGLALVVEPVAAKVMFALAAVLNIAIIETDFLNLVQFIAVASLAHPKSVLVSLVDLGWLWQLLFLLLTLGIVLGFRDHRWLGWLCIGAFGIDLASYILSMATAGSSVNSLFGRLLSSGREFAYLALLAGIAYVLLGPGRAALGTVEQAHQPDGQTVD
jgi:hypothetical protein